MSPYIVTTKRVANGPDPYDAHHGSKFECPECGDVGYLSVSHSCSVSRCAVATLDEAREAAAATIEARCPHTSQEEHDAGAVCPGDALSMGECGGTVGPLPDGTVIEIERATWHDLIDGAGGGFPQIPENADDADAAEIIAAYNANQEA